MKSCSSAILLFCPGTFFRSEEFPLPSSNIHSFSIVVTNSGLIENKPTESKFRFAMILQNTSANTVLADVLYSLSSSRLLQIEEGRRRVKEEKQCRLKILKHLFCNTVGSSTNTPIQEAEKKKTIIIFDWDDTIFPTTHMTKKYGKDLKYKDLSRTDRKELRKIDCITVKLFKKAVQHGIVSLVTNAELDWLLESAEEFLPCVHDFICNKRNNVHILSARDKYEHKFKKSMSVWKYLTFDNLINQNVQKEKDVQIVSIGDAEYEHKASLYSIRNRPGSIVKNLKLRRLPSIAEITKEMKYLERFLNDIIAIDTSMEYEFRRDTFVYEREMPIEVLEEKVRDISSSAKVEKRRISLDN